MTRGQVFNQPMKRFALPVFLLTGLLAGCASSVTMAPTTIPVPLVNKIPISVGLRMPEDFDSFVHEESVYGREEWSIDLGASNRELFTQLFGHMFQSVTVLRADDDPKLMGLDALVEPSIDAFEFSTPSQSRTEAFAVWIRYRLKVYDREGTLISNWPVSAYGKSLTKTTSKDDALRRAAVLAMRDAAALMIMKFDKVTRISELADGPANVATPAARPESTAPGDEAVQATAAEDPEDETT